MRVLKIKFESLEFWKIIQEWNFVKIKFENENFENESFGN